jgi:ABC-type Zn uptake system ZnuABC Zn-binding protein ZnuA
MKKTVLILSILASMNISFAATDKAERIAEDLLKVDPSTITEYSADKYSKKIRELRFEFKEQKDFEEFLKQRELHDLLYSLDNFKG